MTTHTDASPPLVDPRAPRFGQLITICGLVFGIVLQEPLVVLAVAVVPTAAALSGWRLDLHGSLWRHVVIPVVGPPDDRNPPCPTGSRR